MSLEMTPLAIDQLPSLLARYRLLPQLRRELIIDHAIASIPCAIEEIEAAQQQFYQINQIVESERRAAWLQHFGMNEAQLEELALRDLKIEKFKRSQWESQLESIFLTHKAKFDKAIYSLLRTSKLEIAQELFFRIQDEEQSFADAAREFSEGPEAQTGGLIGPVEVSQIHATLAQKLMSGQPGQLHPPIQLEQWFVILRLEQRQSAQLDDTTRQKLLDSLFESWLQDHLQSTAAPQLVIA
ncbi:peptidylprolyl isomerase [Pseudanabaenaceae cyanobacterium LEGE 13415]|nr:peptidylprolyl isomerase [Pseudanabaenaceae cyanobacterium LEGE 13415]